MLNGEQRYYSVLCAAVALLGSFVLFLFTYIGEIGVWTGSLLTAALWAIGGFLLAVLVREKARNWRISSAGGKAQGRIKAIEKSDWLNGPVIVRYVYSVDGKDYEGSGWTTIYHSHQVPKENSACLVSYDRKNPQHSSLEDWLKPYYP